MSLNILRLILLSAILLLNSCKRTNESIYKSYYVDEYSGYEDGTYCAKVEYYYYKTGTRSTYTLKVEIENNELTIIYWPNGGWLDDSHFSPPDISDGYAEFESDEGVEYGIEIIGDEDDCYMDTDAPSETSFIIKEEEENEYGYDYEENNEDYESEEDDSYFEDYESEDEL